MRSFIRPIILFAALLPIWPTPGSAQPIQRVVLTRDTVIDNIPCAPTGRQSAEFHANGRLGECPLSRELQLAGHRFPAGTWIRLYDDGTLDGAWLPHDVMLSGIPCRGDGFREWSVRFHANGTLAICYLRNDREIEGVPCMHGSFWTEIRGRMRTAINLTDQGTLSRCQAARAFTRNGRTYRKWDVVQLAPVTWSPKG